MTATGADQLVVGTDALRRRSDRHARLAARVAALRSRRSGAPASRDRWLLLGGGVLLPLGLLLVVLGWVGASQTVLLFEQVPYVVSGGLLGLALVVVGGFVYWSYWQTLLVREARADRDALTAGLARLESLLERTLAAQVGTAEVPLGAAALVATPRGSMVHRPDCASVAQRQDLRPVPADTPGLAPCRLCDPLGTLAADA